MGPYIQNDKCRGTKVDTDFWRICQRRTILELKEGYGAYFDARLVGEFETFDFAAGFLAGILQGETFDYKFWVGSSNFDPSSLKEE